MDNQQSDDVKEQVTQEPAADSSPSNTETATADSPASADATVSDEAAKSVPYERFKEVNDKYREMETRMAQVEGRFAPKQAQMDPQVQAVKEQLKALGFVEKQDVDAQLAQREQDAQIERHLGKLESEWTGKDGRPAFNRREVIEFALKNGIGNPEVAFKSLKEKEIIDWNIQQAIARSRGVKSEASDGSGSAQAGTTNDDLKSAIAQGDKSALRTFLKRVAKG